jgi:hypothetical protein
MTPSPFHGRCSTWGDPKTALPPLFSFPLYPSYPRPPLQNYPFPFFGNSLIKFSRFKYIKNNEDSCIRSQQAAKAKIAIAKIAIAKIAIAIEIAIEAAIETEN